jgi:hypothetical protein
VIIGGVACDEWFSSQDLTSRATKDIDIVLIMEARSNKFVDRFWEFVNLGGYKNRQKSDGQLVYYRFDKPTNPDFPAMLELFSRKPDDIDLASGQQVVPVPTEKEAASLSAILMNDVYYELIRDRSEAVDGLPLIKPDALIPLKARAWLDLAERLEKGDSVDKRDIKKHRNDVFHLATTLPGQPGPVLDQAIRDDLRRFLDSFPIDSTDWKAIHASLRELLGGTVPKADELIQTLTVYFSLGETRDQPLK